MLFHPPNSRSDHRQNIAFKSVSLNHLTWCRDTGPRICDSIGVLSVVCHALANAGLDRLLCKSQLRIGQTLQPGSHGRVTWEEGREHPSLRILGRNAQDRIRGWDGLATPTQHHSSKAIRRRLNGRAGLRTGQGPVVVVGRNRTMSVALVCDVSITMENQDVKVLEDHGIARKASRAPRCRLLAPSIGSNPTGPNTPKHHRSFRLELGKHVGSVAQDRGERGSYDYSVSGTLRHERDPQFRHLEHRPVARSSTFETRSSPR